MVYCTDPFVTHLLNILTLPNAGKPDDVNNKACKFYITGTDRYTKHLEGFSEHSSIKGCKISMDRYFISVSIAESVTENDFTTFGTMRLDRQGIPKEIKEMAIVMRNPHCMDTKEMRMVCLSLILIKKSGKCNVVILRTLRAGVSVTGDERIKPDVHIFF